MTIGHFSQDVGEMSGMKCVVAAVMDGVGVGERARHRDGPARARRWPIRRQAEKMDAMIER